MLHTHSHVLLPKLQAEAKMHKGRAPRSGSSLSAHAHTHTPATQTLNLPERLTRKVGHDPERSAKSNAANRTMPGARVAVPHGPIPLPTPTPPAAHFGLDTTEDWEWKLRGAHHDPTHDDPGEADGRHEAAAAALLGRLRRRSDPSRGAVETTQVDGSSASSYAPGGSGSAGQPAASGSGAGGVSTALLQSLRQRNFQLALQAHLARPLSPAASAPQGAALVAFCWRAANRLGGQQLRAREAEEERRREVPFSVDLALDISRRHYATAARYDTGSKYPHGPRRDDLTSQDQQPEGRPDQAALAALVRSRRLRHVADAVLRVPGAQQTGDEGASAESLLPSTLYVLARGRPGQAERPGAARPQEAKAATLAGRAAQQRGTVASAPHQQQQHQGGPAPMNHTQRSPDWRQRLPVGVGLRMQQGPLEELLASTRQLQATAAAVLGAEGDDAPQHLRNWETAPDVGAAL